MAPIAFPYNLLDEFPGWSIEFELMQRQEQSRQQGGRTIVKDMGDPLWRATYVTKVLSPNELDRWRARLDVLDGAVQDFRGYPLARWRPIAHPVGNFPSGWGVSSGVGTLATIGALGLITVSGVPAGFVASPGDMIQISTRDLYRVVAGATAGAGGNLVDLEVRPRLWIGTETGQTVRFLSPSCRMTVVPGSVTSTADVRTGQGSISFQAIESR